MRRAVLCSALVLTLATPAAAAIPRPLSHADARHLLDRAAFGPNAADMARLRTLGGRVWLREQLAPASIAETRALERKLAELGTLSLSPMALRRTYFARQAGKKNPARELPLREAQAARYWRAAYGKRQLQEVMVAFWGDHFNVFAGKGPVRVWVGSFEERAIRPHALGSFRAMLGAVAHHPAMLFYLDNWRNSKPGGQRRRFAGLNENYARELLELHTLGVDGGYTQADVVSLARILTGWGIPGERQEAAADAGFLFDAARHEPGDKVLLGRTIRSAGEAEGEAALDLLARHPATARHLARKLARRFVAENPPAALVERLAARFRETDGRIDQVLLTLFESEEFWAPAARGAKLKSPYRLVVSTARALEQPLGDATPAIRAMRRLGQPLFGCQTPDGWPDSDAAWLGPDAMATRTSLAVQAARGRGERAPDPAALEATLGGRWSAATLAAIEAAPQKLRVALMLGSPEFQRH